MGNRNSLKDLADLLAGGNPGDGSSDTMRRLASLGYQTPEEAAEAARPQVDWMFACIRRGFEGCDDNDARVALALIDALRSFTDYTFNEPGARMSQQVSDVVMKYTDVTRAVMAELREISNLRCFVLGREMPNADDFRPPAEGSGSGVADRVEPDIPSFMPPTNEKPV